MTTTTTEVRTRPVIFSGPMIRAIIAGTKTQTRRIVKPQPDPESWPGPIRCARYYPSVVDRDGEIVPGAEVFGFASEDEGWVCPFGGPGERLWVREKWCHWDTDRPKDPAAVWYAADARPEDRDVRWRSPTSLPAWASRITLEIDAVRVERAHSITDADVRAEGVDPAQIDKWRKWLDPRDVHGMAYGELFDSINGKGAWARNDWLWVLSFHRVEAPRA